MMTPPNKRRKLNHVATKTIVKLPDLGVTMKQRLTQIFGLNDGTSSNNNTAHNYYSIPKLRESIESSEFIVKYNIPTCLIVEISNYVGIVQWSNTNKSDSIDIMSSADDNIQYAVVNAVNSQKTNTDRDDYILTQSILLDDWIDVDADRTFKYLFKICHDTNTYIGHETFLSIGLINSNFDASLTNHIGQSGGIGSNGDDKSLAWYINFNDQHCDIIPTKKSFKTHIDATKHENCFDFIMFEINLVEKRIAVFSDSFINDKLQCMVYQIREDFLENQTHIRMGASLQSWRAEECNCMVGLVKL